MKTVFILLFLFLGVVSYSQQPLPTTKQKDAPVKVDSYKFVPSGAGKPAYIEIKFTNVSDKKIQQVRFKWKELNAQGDSLNVGDGDITYAYKPKKSGSALFTISNQAVQKISAVFPYEVTYTDNSRWMLSAY